MRTYPYTFESWPRTKAGKPIFTCTEQAIYFAHLCSHNEGQISQLTILRKEAYQSIATQRSKRQPNYQKMMDLAFKAQFYRECLEEITRINDSQYEL
ncbi:hypothetical protein ES702_06604 [subsurface metagenome]